jgi:hypothetical protein
MLFGKKNSSTENSVEKLVSRFNAPVLEKKFVICEELQLSAGSKEANAVKTFITEEYAMTEHKKRDIHLIRTGLRLHVYHQSHSNVDRARGPSLLCG